MRKLKVLSVLLLVAAGLAVATASPASAATRTVRYGPYTIPANSMIENDLSLNVAKPCTYCYLTGFTPNLVYADGTPAHVNTGVMLHHFVLANQWRSDATCGGDWLGLIGERFFASGDERTPMSMPPGYGYYIFGWDRFNLLTDLMNMSSQEKTVYIEVTYTYTTSYQNSVRPVWLDIDECGDSQYSIPAGPSDTHWDWNVNVPGHIVAIGGHVHSHGHGLRIEATNETTGQSICNSVGAYGETPEYIDMMGNPWLSSMSTCIANPVATINSGNTVRLHSVYDSPEARDDVMGIMIAYVHQH